MKNNYLEKEKIMNEQPQATPPKTIPFGAETFQESHHTEIRWLGNSGIFLIAEAIA